MHLQQATSHKIFGPGEHQLRADAASHIVEYVRDDWHLGDERQVVISRDKNLLELTASDLQPEQCGQGA